MSLEEGVDIGYEDATLGFPNDDGSSDDEDAEDYEDDIEGIAVPITKVGAIGGFNVNFPGTFDNDHSMIIEACLSNLRCGGNILLECPSDKKRRLAILAASLTVQQHLIHEANDENQQVPGSSVGRPSSDPRQKIYYATKSFDEINEVVNELKKFKNTGYLQNIKVAVLAHPSQLCRRCEEIFTCRLPSLFTPNDYHYRFIEEDGSVHDLSHMKRKGASKKFCPYKYNNDIHKHANLVLCTKEFIINSVLRAKHGINLEKAEIIFDDAGSIENACYAETYAAITTEKLRSAGQYFQSLAITFREINQDRHSRELRETSEKFSTLSNCLTSFATAIDVLARAAALPSTDILLDTLRSTGFARDPVNTYNDHIKRALDWLDSDEDARSRVRERRIDIKLIVAVQKLFSSFTYIHNSSNRNDCSLEISKYVPRGAQPANTLKTIFVNLSAIMDPVITPASTVIIGSSCLPPITVLREELLPHVFDEEVIIPEQSHTNCVFAYCSEGPNGVPFKLDFQNQGRATIHVAVGEAILNVIHTIPDGVVVFFPSIPALQRYVTCWQNGENREMSIWDQMKEVKHIYCELDFLKIEDAQARVREFRKRCTSPIRPKKGALLFAFHRERVSEFMDFQPGEVRCFISLGIPFHSKQAFNVKAKETSILSTGDRQRNDLWYNAEAFHNQNEKFAQCVRKEQDWFVGLIFDDRMERKVNSNETDILLPAWMKAEWRKFDDFITLMERLREFVSQNNK